MYDKYDDPYSEDNTELYNKTPVDQAKEIGSQTGDFLKKYAVLIVIGIVGLLVVFFVYDFFVGSYQQVSISVKDTEGQNINADIIIRGADGKPVEQTRSNREVSLKNGDYTIDVAADGFKTISGRQIGISQSNTTFVIEMEIGKKLELSGSFPSSFFTGDEIEVPLTITNNGSEVVEVDLLLGDDAEEVMEIDYAKPLYAGIGITPVTVTLKVEDNPSSKKIGENKDGVIRIEGLNNRKAKVEGKYSLIDLDTSDILIKIGGSKTKADFDKVKTGETKEKTLRIENDTENTITNIAIILEISSTEFSVPEEVQSWFDFDEIIGIVAMGEEQEISISVSVPADVVFPAGKTTETINGKFIVKTSSFERKFNLDLEIEKVEAGIDVDGLRDNYRMVKRDGSYQAQTGSIEITNNGKVLLTDFDMRVVCADSPTGTNWLTIGSNSNTHRFNSLEVKETKDVPFAIEVPNSVRAGLYSRCDIRITYKEPSDEGIKEILTTITTDG